MRTKVVSLLGVHAAQHYADVVKMTRTKWTDRGFFWTLGATTYQDDPEDYPAIARELNPVLKILFAHLYEDIEAAMPEHDFVASPTLGLPGFHIFDNSSNGEQGHPHIDEPYTRCEMPGPFTQPFSFTMLLEEPKCGAGMHYWPNHTDAQIEHYMESGELPDHQTLKYEVGRLYIHDGLTPHRIANFGDMKEGEYRITLQGHGAVLDTGETVLYF